MFHMEQIEPGPLQRRCSKCKAVRPLGWFRRKGERNGKERRSSWCKECERPVKESGDARRRGRLKAQREGSITAEAIRRIGEAQGWRCACGCGRVIRWGYEVDHRVAVANGGVHGVRNLQLLAPICNRRKGAK